MIARAVGDQERIRDAAQRAISCGQKDLFHGRFDEDVDKVSPAGSWRACSTRTPVNEIMEYGPAALEIDPKRPGFNIAQVTSPLPYKRDPLSAARSAP
jgi:hypothetical protein